MDDPNPAIRAVGAHDAHGKLTAWSAVVADAVVLKVGHAERGARVDKRRADVDAEELRAGAEWKRGGGRRQREEVKS